MERIIFIFFIFWQNKIKYWNISQEYLIIGLLDSDIFSRYIIFFSISVIIKFIKAVIVPASRDRETAELSFQKFTVIAARVETTFGQQSIKSPLRGPVQIQPFRIEGFRNEIIVREIGSWLLWTNGVGGGRKRETERVRVAVESVGNRNRYEWWNLWPLENPAASLISI